MSVFQLLSKGQPTEAQLRGKHDSSVKKYIEDTLPDRTAILPTQTQPPQVKPGDPANSLVPWSAEHDLLLLRLRAAGRTIDEIADLFSRSSKSICMRLQRALAMGPSAASVEVVEKSGKRWTEEEDALLVDSFLNKKIRDPADLAKLVQRSPWAVYCRLALTHLLVKLHKPEELEQPASIEWCKTRVVELKVGPVKPEGGARRDREDDEVAPLFSQPGSATQNYNAGQDCAICMTRISTIALRPCGHTFCSTCYRKLENNNCSMCNSQFAAVEDLAQSLRQMKPELKLVSREEHQILAAAHEQEQEAKELARREKQAAAEDAARHLLDGEVYCRMHPREPSEVLEASCTAKYPGRKFFKCASVNGCFVAYGPPVGSSENLVPYCHCNEKATIRVSNTAANPQKPYYTCGRSKCGLFAWAKASE